MSDTFPEQLRDAASKWKKYCAAFAQLRPVAGPRIEVRLQALQIMWQFVGSVEYGKDPLGLLFYHAASDFAVNDASFTVTYLPGGGFTTVKIDFFEDVSSTSPFARWISRVDPKVNTLPPATNQRGSGQWKTFIALSSEARIHRITGSTQVRVRLQPLLKRVQFKVVPQSDAQPIDTHGVLIAVDISQLAGMGTVDYAPDRIVFYQGNTTQVIALFLPDAPVPLPVSPGGKRADATWEPWQPVGGRFVAAHHQQKVHKSEVELKTQALPSLEEPALDLHELAEEA